MTKNFQILIEVLGQFKAVKPHEKEDSADKPVRRLNLDVQTEGDVQASCGFELHFSASTCQ